MDCPSSKLTRDDRDHKRRSCRDDRYRHRDSSDQHNRHRSRRLSCEEECGGSRDRESEHERTYDDKREKDRSSESQLTRDDRDHKRRSWRDDRHRHRDSSDQHNRHRSRHLSYEEECGGSRDRESGRERTYDDKREKGRSSESQMIRGLVPSKLQIVVVELFLMIIMSTHAHVPPPPPKLETHIVGDNYVAPVLGSPLKGHEPKPQRARGLAGHDNVAPLVGSLEKGPVLPSAPNPVTYIPGSGSPHPPPTLPASTTSQRAFVGHNDAPVLGSPLKDVPPAPKSQRAGYDNAIDQKGLAGHAVAPILQAQSRP
ncbi:hypothetical protein FH972_002379 [Carpinus fangiana]|uniref:Uncharacterized protein n=1 Tax=Carpinus fangiana TaxID=176857 RepID=A0A5N6QF75_9ROSI|nr:hypothetical protein FH972_002379 [Carpinus fangiana]